MGSTFTSRTFPGFHRLYWMSRDGEDDEFITHMPIPDSIDILDLMDGDYSPPKPLAAFWEMGGKKPVDVIYTTWGGTPQLLSERIVNMMRDRGFTGWSTFAVDVRRKNRDFIARYYGLVVLGSCGPLDKSRTSRVMVEKPAGVFAKSKGIFFAETSWDGSDFFMPENTTLVIVTERVRDAFLELGAKHVRFKPLDEFIWPSLLPETP